VDTTVLPPTFTPVLDAANRWAAARVNLAYGVDPAPGLLASVSAQLAPVADDVAVSPLALLIESDDPQEWLQSFSDKKLACMVHLLLSAACFAADDAQAALAELKQRDVALIVSGIVEESTGAQAFGINVAHCLNGIAPLALLLSHKYPGPHLALNIDSHTVYRDCAKAGFHWFAGTWAFFPDTSQRPQNITSRNTLLSLLGLVANDADSNKIEALLKRDPNLSFQLLKLVNSVGFSLTHKINNFKQAITLLGRRQLQRWLQLLLYAGQHNTGGVSALLGFAARRAAFMEGIVEARRGQQAEKDDAFMVGLFSLLDVLFKEPIADLVTPLNLNDQISRALIAHEGILGRMLDMTIATETVPDENLAQHLDELRITADAFIRTQLRAFAWAAQVCREM
jgi:c-di-GMP phosphodiesterase